MNGPFISHICEFEVFGPHSGARCVTCNEPARDAARIADALASLLNELEIQDAELLSGRFGSEQRMTIRRSTHPRSLLATLGRTFSSDGTDAHPATPYDSGVYVWRNRT